MADFTREDIEEAIRYHGRQGNHDKVLALSVELDKLADRPQPRSDLGTEKSELVERARAAGQDPRQILGPEPDPMTFIEGMDRGLEGVALGAAQLGARAWSPAIAPLVDAEVRRRQEVAPNSPQGEIGNLAGEAVGMMAAGGAGTRGGQLVGKAFPKVLGPVAEGMGAGAAEGLAYPADPDNYWGQKAANTALGAATGGLVDAGARGLLQGATEAVNAPRRAGNAINDMMEGAAANAEDAAAGARLADDYGVALTPGQRSGSWPVQFAEQRARESFISAGRVLQGDEVRANQYMRAIQDFAGDTDSTSAATYLQGQVGNFVQDQAKARSAWGRQAYGEIDRMAQGQKIVQPRNLYDELNAIIQEAGTQEGGDIVKAAAQARKMLETIDKQGGYTAQEALGRLQNWSPFSKGTVFDEVSKGYDAVLKRRVYGAIMKDLDETGAQGGSIGDMVREANAGWRKYTENIQSIESSALGKMLGEDVASEFLEFNTKSPEQVFDALRRMKPSQARYTAKFLEKNMPDVLVQVRAGMLNDALDAAMMGAPTGGGGGFNPAAFLDSLGLKSRKAGVEGMSRLEALFGKGTKEWAQMQDLINIGYRLADSTGRNFSGTSAGNQFFRLLGDLAQGSFYNVQRLGSTAAEFAGLRKVAESMNPTSTEFGRLPRRPLLQPPRVLKRNASAPAVVAPGYVLAEEGQQQ